MTSIHTQSNGTEQEEVDVFFSEKLETPEEMALAARIDMYALMADVYRYPDALTLVYVRNGEFRSHFLRISGGLPYVMDIKESEKELLTYQEGSSDEDVEAEFIRLFEAGPGHPPISLVEGIHMDREDGRKSIFKDLILFYNNFGLSYAEGTGEDRPDHITYELEFMHYLAFLELKALQGGKETQHLRRAQKDFLERHPAKWMGMLVSKIKQIEEELREGINTGAVSFYRNVMELTERFVAQDLDYLTNLIEN